MEVKVTLPFDKTWTVYEVPDNDPKLIYKNTYSWGLTYFKSKEIYIDQTLTREHKAEVIRHELTHALIFETQFTHTKKYSEEDLCDLMGSYGKIICELADKVFKKLNKEK